MAKGFFITGTDTGVGKTWVTAGLLRALQVQGYTTAAMKPVACGGMETTQGLHNEDALLLMEYASIKLPYEVVNPYAFAPPMAPHLAAKACGQRIDITRIKELFDGAGRGADYIVVEGVGGWKVPLNERETTVDLAAALSLPVVLVVGMRLGCLNHALLSDESITRRGMIFAGWIANSIDPLFKEIQENIEALREGIAAPLLGVVPYLPNFVAGPIAGALDLGAILRT